MHELNVDLGSGKILDVRSDEDAIYMGLDIEDVSDMIVNPHCYRGTTLIGAKAERGISGISETGGSIQGNTQRTG